MYTTRPSFVFGFHGTDKTVAMKILTQETVLVQSENTYDWLGKGTYFWENSYERALQYAKTDMKRSGSKIKEPFVLGAVIDLGNCFDLLDQKYLDFLQLAYEDLKETVKAEKNGKLPQNKKFGIEDFDFRKRELDCAVIRWAHKIAEEQNEKFDTVRAAFQEGKELYPGAGFKKHNHIQIAVINTNSIKGIFLPREKS